MWMKVYEKMYYRDGDSGVGRGRPFQTAIIYTECWRYLIFLY